MKDLIVGHASFNPTSRLAVTSLDTNKLGLRVFLILFTRFQASRTRLVDDDVGRGLEWPEYGHFR